MLMPRVVNERSLTVIIPTYNRREALLRAITSVMEQSHEVSEIIIIDDKSNFSVEDLLRSYHKRLLKEEKLKVITNEKNIGSAASRNIGARHAIGKYVAFLDSDDTWLPNKCQEQIKLFEANDSIDLVYCDQFLNRSGKLLKSGKILHTNDVLHHLSNGWTAPNTSTLMFKKDSFLNVGGFSENLKSCQDHDLWFKVASQNFKIQVVMEPLTVFNLDGSDRISKNMEARLQGSREFMYNCRQYMNTKQHKRFQSQYIAKVLYPIFTSSILERDFLTSCQIYYKHLWNNRYFYFFIIQNLLKSISKLENQTKKEK